MCRKQYSLLILQVLEQYAANKNRDKLLDAQSQDQRTCYMFAKFP